MKATVYLLHFSEKLSTNKKFALHYVGFTTSDNVENRIETHKKGWGAVILRECNRRKIDYFIAKTWDCPTCNEARELERKLKRERHFSRHCPVCNPVKDNPVFCMTDAENAEITAS
jgi:predicted GIY-YIG superfamily endonuclease